ncbi:hypothetical protein [Phyllobacterium salinisoli]|nr:hypothetical protein [Phyllobacterium salinisoli]
MTTHSKKPDGPEVDQWGVPYAKTRDWTDEEVAVAVEYVKKDIPEAWAELERLEVATGDLRGSDAIGLQFATLAELHPECEFYEIGQLESKVRAVRRAQLGLK